MKEWKTYKLEDLLSTPVRNGLTKPSSIRGKGVKMIGMGELFANEIIRDIEMPRVPTTESELKLSSIEKGDLLFARQSLTLEGAGKCSLVKEVTEPTIFESHIIRCRVNKSLVLPEYLYYYFRSRFGRYKIECIVEQVAAAGIRGKDLIKIEIPVPDIQTQRGIVDCLSTLDEKIHYNSLINDNLEQQAQALYKSWFVDFEPFKDGEFIESELGQIPEGWQCIPFSMFVSESKAKTGKIGIKEYSVTNNGIFPRDAKYNKSLSQSSTKNKLILYGDLVFGMSRDILNWGVMQEEQGGVSSAYTVYNINSGIVNSTYLELFIKSRIHLFSDLIRPAAREGQGIDKSVLQTKVLLCPPQEVLDTFWPLYNSVTNQIQRTTTEINCLGDVRDTLLPKLMSGELKINEIDC